MSGADVCFVTGGSGYIGRALLDRLAATLPPGRLRVLVRPGRDLDRWAGRVEPVRGDLRTADEWSSRLVGCGTVVHLAATTGRAPAAVHAEVNARGTERLVRACRTAGVDRFIFVSSIAATFPDRRHYPYAESKAEAEAIVARSGLQHAIIRPTIVLGPDAPAWCTLRTLARNRVVLVPGRGRVRVQPVWRDDVAEALAALVTAATLPNSAYDVGGPEVTGLGDFVQRINEARHGRRGRVVHVPVRPVAAALALLEFGIGLPVPISAGQLSVFLTDSLARTAPPAALQPAAPLGIDAMLATLAADGRFRRR